MAAVCDATHSIATNVPDMPEPALLTPVVIEGFWPDLASRLPPYLTPVLESVFVVSVEFSTCGCPVC